MQEIIEKYKNILKELQVSDHREITAAILTVAQIINEPINEDFSELDTYPDDLENDW